MVVVEVGQSEFSIEREQRDGWRDEERVTVTGTLSLCSFLRAQCVYTLY